MKKVVYRVAVLPTALLLGMATISLLGATSASAAVWTDRADYSPGSTVTVSGDNSNGAGYLGGETVIVDFDGPSGKVGSCSATADDAGAWSCQFTLGTGVESIGAWTYTATGQTSGVSESGSFTDSGCKDADALGTFQTSPDVGVTTSDSGNTRAYNVTYPNKSPSGGIPGLIEYCVYPGPTAPDTVSATYDSWDDGISNPYANHGYFDFDRSGGDPTNLPFGSASPTQVGTATWSGGIPAAQTIALHINDPAECGSLYSSGTKTCFVLPGTGVTKKDLTVSKTATPSYSRTFSWDISKSVNTA